MASRAPRKRPTIYDVATEAAVSGSTVSLVLNGSWQRYRIAPRTAERVLVAAERLGYAANQRARGLRLNRSSLAGMLVPHHRNRFFAGLCESFEAAALERGLCPVVVSTQRDADTAREVARTLVAQRVELLVLAGVQGALGLDALCVEAGIRCVNLDLPGHAAPSVVSDNRGGARELTGRLIETVRAAGGDPSSLGFIGGLDGEHATDERVAGFLDAGAAHGLRAGAAIVRRCGYEPRAARAAFERVAREGMPAGLFVNSITALEGFVGWRGDRPIGESGSRDASAGDPVVACFDWDPFAAMLSLPVLMMRQDVEGLIDACFELLDAGRSEPDALVTVSPSLVVHQGRS